MAIFGMAAGGYAAYGQVQAGKAQQRRNEYEAQLAEMQAALTRRTAEQQKTLTQAEAAEQSKILAQKTAELGGEQKVAMAAAGIGDSVTATDIAAGTVTKSQLDQAAIRYNADITNWAIEEEAKTAEWSGKQRAKQFRLAGKEAIAASKIAATSTLLSSAGSVAGAATKKYDSKSMVELLKNYIHPEVN